MTGTSNAKDIVLAAWTQRFGGVTLAEVNALARDQHFRLTPVLIRCGGCRMTVPANQVAAVVGIIEREKSDYVRDLSLVGWSEPQRDAVLAGLKMLKVYMDGENTSGFDLDDLTDAAQSYLLGPRARIDNLIFAVEQRDTIPPEVTVSVMAMEYRDGSVVTEAYATAADRQAAIEEVAKLEGAPEDIGDGALEYLTETRGYTIHYDDNLTVSRGQA